MQAYKMVDLQTVLFPTSEDVFLRETLGDRPLHVPGEPAKFTELMSWRDLNEILDSRNLSSQCIKLVKESHLIPSDSFLRIENGLPRLLVAEVTGALREGATLIIDHIDQLHPPISMLCQALERSLDVPVQANLSASWIGTKDDGLQWADHDALMLQIIGRKRWAVYTQTMKCPVGQSAPARPTAEPIMEVVLASGDALYIPRGWWRTATPMDEPTVYLTIGFKNPTGLDLVGHVMQSLHQDSRMRVDFPRFKDAEAQANVLTGIQRAVTEACAEPGLTLSYLRDVQAAATPRPSFSLPWSASPTILLGSDNYLIVSSFRFKHILDHVKEEDAIEILFNRQKFRFQESAEVLFERLLSVRSLPLRDFIAEFEATIGREELVAFVSNLVTFGLVALVAMERKEEKAISLDGLSSLVSMARTATE